MTDTIDSTRPTPAREVDPDRLDAFLGRVIGDLGATVSAALVVLGDRLGLYAALADGEPVTTDQLAGRTGTVGGLPRAVAGQPGRRRLRGVRRRHRHVVDDTRSRRRRSATADSPAFFPGEHAAGARRAARRSRRSRSGSARAPVSAGTSTTATSSPAPSGSSGPGTSRTSSPTWLPALDGVVDKLERRSRGRRRRLRPRRLDDPDGPGVPARPRSPGIDYHEASIVVARRRAERGRRRRPGHVRGRRRRRPARGPGRAGHDVRLPARHGRPRRRGPRRTSRARPTTAR